MWSQIFATLRLNSCFRCVQNISQNAHNLDAFSHHARYAGDHCLTVTHYLSLSRTLCFSLLVSSGLFMDMFCDKTFLVVLVGMGTRRLRTASWVSILVCWKDENKNDFIPHIFLMKIVGDIPIVASSKINVANLFCGTRGLHSVAITVHFSLLFSRFVALLYYNSKYAEDCSRHVI